MRAALASAVLAAGLGALACGSPPPPAPSAWVEVELLSGASAAPEARPAGEQRLQLILDLTRSLEDAWQGETSPRATAQAAAVRLLRSLPDRTEVGLQVLGIASGTECPPPIWFSSPAREATPAQLATGLGPLRSRSEGSLGEALARARAQVEASGAAASWRVVLLSDLGLECGGDPCAEIQQLVNLGTRVDVILLGAEPAPACLDAIEVPEAPTQLQVLAPPAPPAYRVESVAGEPASQPSVLARGRVGEAPLAVAPGRALVVLETEPPFEIGPVDLRTGVVTTVRGVDFPSASPSWRAWGVARRDADAGGSP